MQAGGGKKGGKRKKNKHYFHLVVSPRFFNKIIVLDDIFCVHLLSQQRGNTITTFYGFIKSSALLYDALPFLMDEVFS